MIIQIENSRILTDINALNNISNPVHGDYYFITSEGTTYSYYNTLRNNNAGEWRVDDSLILYRKYETLLTGYTDVTSFYPNVLGTPLEEVKKLYRQYEIDGIEYNNTFRAEMVVKYKAGLLTATEIYAIEADLEQVRRLVNGGDWLTALNELTNNVTVDANLTQETYDGILTYIQQYILNNY